MNTVLVLRTCKADLSSHNDTFKWPESGPVVCPDWNPVAKCGQGLHGLLWGEGDGRLLNWSEDAKWLVVEVQEEEIVDLSSKVKFPRGNVVFCGNQYEATQYLHSNGGRGRAIVGYMATAGYGGTAVAGAYGAATCGSSGTATAGAYGAATCGAKGTAVAGACGTATCGAEGTAVAGDYGTATAGAYGKATAGDGGKATCGDYGTATCGDGGTATCGDGGTATAGPGGTAMAGPGGTAMAGDGGYLSLSWWDSKNDRRRTVVGYVGENGILPNELYKLDEKGRIIRAEAQK